MAASQNIRSRSRAQSRAHKPRKQRSAPKRQKAKEPAPTKQESLPPSLRYIETKRGKTTIRRYDSRHVYRLEEVKGKVVDRVEIFLAAEDSSIVVRFDDQTSLGFGVEPGFTLIPEHYDFKTGNLKTGDLRSIKRWPPIRSLSHRA
jgi:hypothetical protein